ncbi:sigma-70 family RNA polymerase sigma factor [Jeotgalibaca sp. A122]|uniref:sigma-70 family RNA polymerase sigma factor n=1 Tax=Jeotgalibaca sp. A122 TaxID=3457322 RepID=UPI003FD60263
MRSEQEAIRAIELYGDTVTKICMVYLKNRADTEDIFQTVFLKYATNSPAFTSDEHEKAWIIRVTINACKDFLKSFFQSKVTTTDQINEQLARVAPEDHDLIRSVLALPKNYREVIYLFYYENYSAVEIAELLGKNVNTIYTRLARAKEKLKAALGDEWE